MCLPIPFQDQGNYYETCVVGGWEIFEPFGSLLGLSEFIEVTSCTMFFKWKLSLLNHMVHFVQQFISLLHTNIDLQELEVGEDFTSGYNKQYHMSEGKFTYMELWSRSDEGKKLISSLIHQILGKVRRLRNKRSCCCGLLVCFFYRRNMIPKLHVNERHDKWLLTLSTPDGPNGKSSIKFELDELTWR